MTATEDQPAKTARGYTPLNDTSLAAICEDIELGMSTKFACAASNVNYNNLENLICGEKPRKPEWRQLISGARSRCIRWWLNILRTCHKDSAMVKACQLILGAMDPDTYREQRDQPMAGNVINFILGSDGSIVDTQVIEPQRKRRGRPLQLKAVDVDKGAE